MTPAIRSLPLCKCGHQAVEAPADVGLVRLTMAILTYLPSKSRRVGAKVTQSMTSTFLISLLGSPLPNTSRQNPCCRFRR